MVGASPSGEKRVKSGRSALLAKARAQGGGGGGGGGAGGGAGVGAGAGAGVGAGGGSQSQNSAPPQSQSAPEGAAHTPAAAPSQAASIQDMSIPAEGVQVLGKEEDLEDRAAAFGFAPDPANPHPIAAQLLKYPLPPTALLPELAFPQACGRGCRCRAPLPSPADGTPTPAPTPLDSSCIPSLDRYAAAHSGRKRKGSQGNGAGLWGSSARSTSSHLTGPAAKEVVKKLKAARLLGPDHEEPPQLGSKVPYTPPSFADPHSRAHPIPSLPSLLPAYSRFFATLTPGCPHLPHVAAAAEHTLRTTVAQEALAAGQAALSGGPGPHTGLGIPGMRQGQQQQQLQQQSQQQQQQGGGVGGAGPHSWGGAPPGAPQSSFVSPSWFDRGSGSFVKPPWEAHAPSALAALAQLHMTQWQKH